MVQHRLKLHIAKDISQDPGIVAAKTIGIRERLLRMLLGKQRKVTLVVPGDAVRQIDITETDDDLVALAEAVGVSTGGDRK
ncbi:hypothetical protein [Brevibacterium paucivorans]|uniref:Uncharacterized protein n=1 Tax=Brevibacterium paucivorans TaxID=170994 RepID=A0A2N6VQZ9_9MICO|nr:hypothetical protein [Brevibacterium paucivorans]PMD06458.1 hypothetical protein CJ199_03585 [Brevibacterium paucivorans]